MAVRKSARARKVLQPCALTVAGSDSGGGAGIQADLKTFAALGVHGASAITCITAQNPREVRGVAPISAAMVRSQIEAVAAELRPAAAKTGMLYSSEIIQAAAESLKALRIPVVVDPVMVSTSGAALLKPSAVRRLADQLFPIAALVTPNLDEAGMLLERPPDLRPLRLPCPGQGRASSRRSHRDRFFLRRQK